MNEYKRITWLASYPKSGNTWVRMFLSAYFNNGELDFNDLTPCKYDDGTSFKYGKHAEKNGIISEEAQLLLRNSLLYTILEKNPGAIYLKTHNANITMDGVQLIPQVVSRNAIYIVRDPRDIVISFADHFNKSIDDVISILNDNSRKIVDDKNNQITGYLGTWSNHINSWNHNKMNMPSIIFKYENFHIDPEKAFTGILIHLNLPIVKPLFIKTLDIISFENVSKKEDKEGFREKSNRQKKFFRQGTVNQWKTILTKEQVYQIEMDHNKVMKLLKYELEQKDG